MPLNPAGVPSMDAINEAIADRRAGGKVPSAAPGINFASPVEHTITFPAGRFTEPPVISIATEGARCVITPGAVTATGMTATVWNTTGAAAGPFVFHWTATQYS